MTHDPLKESRELLARYLAAAYIAYSHGITPTTALKNYTSKGPIGKFWTDLACIVDESNLRRLDEAIHAANTALEVKPS